MWRSVVAACALSVPYRPRASSSSGGGGEAGACSVVAAPPVRPAPSMASTTAPATDTDSQSAHAAASTARNAPMSPLPHRRRRGVYAGPVIFVRGRVGERRTTLNNVAPLPPARLSGVSCAHRWPAFNNRQRRILPAIPLRVASGGTPKALHLTNRNGVPRTVRPSILATWSCGPQHRACGWSRLPAGSVAVFACDPRIGDGRGRSAAMSFIRCLQPTDRGREASPRRSRFTAGCIFNLVRLRRTMDARSWLMRRDHRPSPITGEEHRTEGAAP